MKFVSALVLTLLLKLNLVKNIEIKEEDNILIINNSNIEKALETNKCLLINFYDPWCPHCKKFEPEFKQLAANLKEEKSFINLGSVDAIRQTFLDDMYKIKEYPTLKLFIDEEIFTYSGPKVIQEIRKWLKKKCENPSVYIGSEEDLKKLKEENEVAVLGLFKNIESDKVKVFNKISRLTDTAYFGISSRSKFFKQYKIDKDEGVVLFKKFDEGQVNFEGDINEKELEEFIRINKIPLISEFNEKNAQNLFGTEIKTHSVLIVSKNNTEYEQYLTEFKEAAKDFRGKVMFVVLDVDISENNFILDFFELKPSDQPALRLVSLKGNATQYRPTTLKIDRKSIIKFVNEIVNNDPKILEKDEL